MKTLALGIFDGLLTQKQIREKIVAEFEADEKEVAKYEYLVAYVDYGSYEGSGWILMRDKETGLLFENHSSHCSCYGNEGQFSPEPCTIEYLKSDKFSMYSYGDEERAVREYLKKLKV